MPQPGLHAVLALATRKRFSTKRWFALGLVFGSLLPDADSYAQACAMLLGGLDPQAAEVLYHRTFTHSLLFAGAVAGICALLAHQRESKTLRTFGFGLATGMAVLHSLLDIFAWFDAVGILWPLRSVNLWHGVTIPAIGIKLLRAANFYAFAAYFAYLAALTHHARTDVDYVARLRQYTYMHLTLGLLLTILAFVLSAYSYNLVDGAIFLVFAYPNAPWITWRMRATIEAP